MPSGLQRGTNCGVLLDVLRVVTSRVQRFTSCEVVSAACFELGRRVIAGTKYAAPCPPDSLLIIASPRALIKHTVPRGFSRTLIQKNILHALIKHTFLASPPRI